MTSQELGKRVGTVFVIMFLPICVLVWSYTVTHRDSLTEHVIVGAGALQEQTEAMQINCVTALMEARTRIEQYERTRRRK